MQQYSSSIGYVHGVPLQFQPMFAGPMVSVNIAGCFTKIFQFGFRVNLDIQVNSHAGAPFQNESIRVPGFVENREGHFC